MTRTSTAQQRTANDEDKQRPRTANDEDNGIKKGSISTYTGHKQSSTGQAKQHRASKAAQGKQSSTGQAKQHIHRVQAKQGRYKRGDFVRVVKELDLRPNALLARGFEPHRSQKGAMPP